MKENAKTVLKAVTYLIAVGLAAGIALIGIWETCKAIIGYSGVFNGGVHLDHEGVMTGILKGMECIFLSPMPLLLAFAIRDLVKTYQVQQKAMNPEEIAFAHEKLHKLKGVIIGLMATALAAGLLEKTFGHSVELEAIAPHLMLMLLLILYSFVIGKIK